MKYIDILLYRKKINQIDTDFLLCRKKMFFSA